MIKILHTTLGANPPGAAYYQILNNRLTRVGADSSGKF